MTPKKPSARASITRRSFITATAGAAALASSTLRADTTSSPSDALPCAAACDPATLQLLAKRPYITPLKDFAGFVREKPIPYEFSTERLREVKLHPDTWRLEVVAEDAAKEHVERPLTIEAGNAITFADLVKLGETRAVRFIKTIACTLVSDPFGTGVWEGVALRDVVWLARPTAKVRRLYYYGFHNGDPNQKFQSSLPLSRVLEEPPGELPVILCYKYNGQWLPPKMGGPVRMIVPEGYGNKNVKWIQRIVLTDNHQNNDTYASWGNDTESPIKTCARFSSPAHKVRIKPNEKLPIIGTALVGISGLSKVQYSLHPLEAPLPADDPYLTKLPWRDAQILPPPTDWGSEFPGGKLPPIPLQFDEKTKAPKVWPPRFASAQWAATTDVLKPGRYLLRCRTIDLNGNAQPMPRPLPRTGDNMIQEIEVSVMES